MGNPNSKRARRRLLAKLENDPNMVYWMGRWMVRTITSETVDLGNGLTAKLHNETWSDPAFVGIVGLPDDIRVTVAGREFPR